MEIWTFWPVSLILIEVDGVQTAKERCVCGCVCVGVCVCVCVCVWDSDVKYLPVVSPGNTFVATRVAKS